MIGTAVNVAAIVAGGLVGVAAGERLPDRFKSITMQALGLSVLTVGLRMALSADRTLLAVGCVLAGGLLGEALGIEHRIGRLGELLKRLFRSGSGTFVEGFVSATILYCTGAMMIVGSIQDGTVGDPQTLYVKSLLDGVASVALASSLGIGVAASGLSVLIAQGSITLLASHLGFLQAPQVLEAITATGGILILGIGLNLLNLAEIRIGNLLPALALAIAGSVWGL